MANADNPIEIDAGALARSFRPNDTEAALRLMGHSLVIQGDVAALPVSIDQVSVVRLQTGTAADYVDVIFVGDNGKRAAALRPHRTITATCDGVQGPSVPIVAPSCTGLSVWPK